MAFFGRGKNRNQDPYTVPDFYKAYKDKVEKGSPYDVSYDTFRDALELYYKGISDILIEDGLPFKLPCNLGEFKVIKKKMNYSNLKPSGIDWVNTIKYGKVIYHLNEHSDGYRHYFMWNKARARLKNISKYKFEPTRTNKRKLASYVKNKVRDYFEDK